MYNFTSEKFGRGDDYLKDAITDSGNTKIIAITCDGNHDYQNTSYHNKLKTKPYSALYPEESEKGNFLFY